VGKEEESVRDIEVPTLSSRSVSVRDIEFTIERFDHPIKRYDYPSPTGITGVRSHAKTEEFKA